MKKLYYLIVIVLISSLILTGCSLLSNISQVPATEQSGIIYLTKNGTDLDPGLVGLWRFDEGSGTDANDSSGNGNHGILTNMNTDTCWVPSNYGTALLFDGANDYVEVDDSESLRITGELTIEAWVKEDSIGKFKKIVSRRIGNYFYFLGVNYGKPYGGIGNGSTYTVITQTVTMESNKWHHLAFVYNDATNTMYIYCDGVQEETEVTQILPAPTGVKLGIGADFQGTSNFFKGLIDEVRIWSSVLDLSQLDDMIPPTITSLNEGETYFLNQVVAANGSATDDGTGVDLVTTSVVNLDTSTVGAHTFTVTATDYAMNEVTQEVTYYVLGFSGILPPFKPEGISVFKLGRTIPVKFQLWDSIGDFVGSAVAEIFWKKSSEETLGTEEGEFSTVAATTGNQFRYDDIDNQYIFNLSTKNLSTGTWKITIIVNDSGSYSEEIVLK